MTIEPLSGATVVVTGASAGVGRATARAFAARGANVALLARGEDGLRAAREEVERHGVRAQVVATDVADPEQVEEAASRVEDVLGPIDVWVNDAMTTVFAPLHEIEPHEFRRAIDVTFLGQVHGTMAALRRMRPRDHGSIVNVGSALAYRAIPLQAPYCAAKFAVRGFTDSVRTELLHEGSNVRISMVHLPALDTPQFEWCLTRMPRHPQPVPPIYEPEVAAAAIVGVATSGQRAKFVGSWNWALVQLNKLIPGILDFYAARTAVGSQQTDDAVAPDRPSNLFEPVDAAGGGDRGARGTFGDRAAGSLDPAFLRTVPRTARALVAAAAARLRDVTQHRPTFHETFEATGQVLADDARVRAVGH